MATAEAASATLGPRYAPDDPSLPKPWKGLIDGSTGLLYYWNPETNVTQYERPASLPAPSAAVSTPKLSPLPVGQLVQSNGGVAELGQQHGQQLSQLPPQHGQVRGQQQSSTLVPVSDQQGIHPQGSQMGHAMQQPGQYAPQQIKPQMMHHHVQQMMSVMGQSMPQHPVQHAVQPQGQHMPQQPGLMMQPQVSYQMSQKLGIQAVQNQNPQMAQPQVHQYAHEQVHFMPYPQSIPPQSQQTLQQTQLGGQGQQNPNQQELKTVLPKREEVDFQQQQGNKTGFSPSQFQQPASSSQDHTSGKNSGQMPPTGVHPGHSQQFAGSSINIQQPTAMVHMQQTGAGFLQQHGPRFHNQMDSAIMHKQQSDMPASGFNTGYEDSFPGKARNDNYNSTQGTVMGLQQPTLAPIPMMRNQQEMRMGVVPPQSNIPAHLGGLNAAAGHALHNIYSHGPHGGSPYPNNAPIRPSFGGPLDAKDLSPAEAYRKQHEVTAKGDNVPAPFMAFEATGFPPEILRDIHYAGFSCPTPIQAQTWPIALQGRDIVAIAKTGSGKTLGYLIPAFILLRQWQNNPQNGPTVLVLAPTRELATQIQEEALKFGRSSRVSCTCLYGGAPKTAQLRELDRGADIVVATPGRLNDILEMGKIDFRQVSLLVLDEADRMLDMGFEPQIRKIVNEIPPRRQTLMYTATWPKEVRKIASDLLVNPVQVNIGSVDELVANQAITQYVELVPQMEKDRRLEQILRAQEWGSKVIIFCSTKRLCDQLARSLGRNFGATAIHGDKSQGERDWVLNQFRSGKSPILVATDVAARGLDIKDIRVVINYDFPTGIEDYVHRIGRTGRAGATGVAYTFLSDQDCKHVPDLIKVLEGTNQHVPPVLREMSLRGGPSFGRDRGGIGRFDSHNGGGRWDSGGRGGMRDGGFSGSGRIRDGGFGGRGGMRDVPFGGRGGFRDSGFGGRGGMRDGGFGIPGGRGNFSGRGNRGRGFGGHGGWGRNDRGLQDRHGNFGRERFDNRRDVTGKGRARSYSRSPERSHTRRYSRSRSRSRSWSRSRSQSRSRSHSRSRSRSWSRGCSRSPRHSYSRSPHSSRSGSRSRSHDRYERLPEKNFDQKDVKNPEIGIPPESGTSPMSPGTQGNAFSGTDHSDPLPVFGSTEPVHIEMVADTVNKTLPES